MALLDPKAAQNVRETLRGVRGWWSLGLSMAGLVIATVSVLRAFDIALGISHLPRLSAADAAYACAAIAAAVWAAKNT